MEAGVQYLTAQIALFQQVAEAKSGRLNRRRGYAQIPSGKAARHWRLMEASSVSSGIVIAPVACVLRLAARAIYSDSALTAPGAGWRDGVFVPSAVLNHSTAAPTRGARSLSVETTRRIFKSSNWLWAAWQEKVRRAGDASTQHHHLRGELREGHAHRQAEMAAEFRENRGSNLVVSCCGGNSGYVGNHAGAAFIGLLDRPSREGVLHDSPVVREIPNLAVWRDAMAFRRQAAIHGESRADSGS